MKNFMIKTKMMYCVLLSILLLATPVLSYAQSTGLIEVSIKYQSGDRVNVDGMIFKVYQDAAKTPYKEILSVTGNPYMITSLPVGHLYKIEVYVHGQYAGVGLVNLQKTTEKTDIIIPSPGGLRFTVYYSDGATPIANATISIKSPDKMRWGLDVTDKNGQTTRMWLQPTIQDKDYYYAEIALGPNLLYIQSPIKLSQGIAQDFKIVTKWPVIIDKLITVQLYKTPSTKVSKSDGSFVIEMYDSKKKKIAESDVNAQGETHFSKFKVNNYAFIVKNKIDTSKILTAKRATVTGLEDTLKIYLNNPELNNENTNCNCVAFRLDDVQDFFLNVAQIEIMKTFQQKEASLTIGIIGGVIGTDQKIISPLKDRIAQNDPTLEIASHSWNSRVLTSMTKSEQADLINKTDKKIIQTLGIKAEVFIPPENLFNNDTINILKQNNYTHISYHTNIAYPPVFKKSPFYEFPAYPTTAKLDPLTGYWKPYSNDAILEQIQDSIFNYGFAVVMMHPYEFSNFNDGFYENKVNPTEIQKLGELIDIVKAEKLQIVSIGRIDTYEKPIVIEKKPQDQETTKPKPPNCNCVAFRLDNIQDFYLNDVQNGIIDTFQKNNADLTVTVIGKVFGDDTKAVGFLKEKLKDNNSLKIGNRGWEFIDHSQYGKEEQSASIKKTNDKLITVLGVKPSIFAPPFNGFNNNTISAMRENGMGYISAAVSTDPPPYELRNSVPFHIPQTMSMTDLLADDPFLTGTPIEKAVAKIQANDKQYGFSVISIQPQDFAVKTDVYQNEIDTAKMEQLASLIAYLQNNGVKVVTIEAIPKDATSQTSPIWIGKIHDWYEKGMISHNELLNAIKFLIGKNIILFN